jgi:Na+-driven multidrug efflux pump
LLVEGTVLLTTIYYQSINKIKVALLINMGKIFFLLLPLLFILPIFFGLDGVWFASPSSECIMLVIVLGMLSKEFKFLRDQKEETDDSGPKYNHFRTCGLKY